jgi:hypothetical protein
MSFRKPGSFPFEGSTESVRDQSLVSGVSLCSFSIWRVDEIPSMYLDRSSLTVSAVW